MIPADPAILGGGLGPRASQMAHLREEGEEAAHIAENDILRPPQFRLMLLGQHSSYGIA